MIPVPLPVFAVPGFGIGMEYFVPRVRYWKFDLRCIFTVGAPPGVVGAVVEMVVRSNEALPHEGQNFLEESLHIL